MQQKYNKFLFRAQHRFLYLRRSIGIKKRILIEEIMNIRGHICGCYNPHTQGGLIETINIRKNPTRVEFHTPEMQRMDRHNAVVHAFSHWMGSVVNLFTEVQRAVCFTVE